MDIYRLAALLGQNVHGKGERHAVKHRLVYGKRKIVRFIRLVHGENVGLERGVVLLAAVKADYAKAQGHGEARGR